MLCQSCKEDKPHEDFPVRNDRSGRLRPYCKSCAKNSQRARYSSHRKNNPFLHRCTRAKSRAKGLKVPFNLTPEYLESLWTGICPVLKVSIDLVTDSSNELAAELDRFIPELGYVEGNVQWLSRKANRIKNNTSIEVLENLLQWMKGVSSAG